MRLRDLGLGVIAVGVVGGQLLGSLAMRNGFESMAAAGGSANPADFAMASARSLNFVLGGYVIALVGIAIFFLGSISCKRPKGDANLNAP